jgi:hypothetical protein
MKFDDLVNLKQLTAVMGRAENFGTAMKRAGYKLQYPGLGKTTVRHALEALTNEDFVANHYLTKGWERLSKCLGENQSQPA